MSDTAIPAATLVVVRDRPAGAPELLMVQRTATMAFAAGAMVFPGGRIDAADRDQAGDDELGAARVAAIRETLEESGIAVGLSPQPDPAVAAELQRRLHAGAGFAALLAEHRLALDPDALTFFTRWRPSFRHARIFDTRFFLAAVPPGDWTPLAQEGECADALWITAEAMLDRIGRGGAQAIFPTVRNLERLARFASHEEAIRDTLAHPAELVSPWVEARDGVDHVCIPSGIGYPVTSEPLSSAVRA
ncbi:NUDIX hydrolase [Sphingomonas ginkgonis]|nr:NUDIX domain-containing protein [Sphingomonas ginkgonis]